MENSAKKVLAFDFGASSGRAMLGEFDGKTIILEEIHRFENNPVRMGDTLYWDIYRLFYEVKQGILKASLAGGFDSIGVDTWGVDFGLIGVDGQLIEAPVHYRDSRTNGVMDYAFSLLDKETFYKITGNQFMEINTVFQLLALKQKRPHILEKADKLLMMPDLFNYLLTGEMKTELSIASTTQMLSSANNSWSDTILGAFDLPKEILTPTISSGTVIGKLRNDICEELNAPAADVIAVCGHDTGCAAFAVPVKNDEDFLFISCGTWSLFGTELDEPILLENSDSRNLVNEIGYDGKITFIKNIIGLLLIQETRRQYKLEGKEYTYAILEMLANSTKPFTCFINPDAPEFAHGGDIPSKIKEFCRKTNQYVPETVGEIVRCIYESLAFKYKQAFMEIKQCTGKDYKVIHLVGGGANDKHLCQMTADACGCDVIAGPTEATAYGNVAIQLVASGEIVDIGTAREIIANSCELKTYSPFKPSDWDFAYAEYVKYQD